MNLYISVRTYACTGRIWMDRDNNHNNNGAARTIVGFPIQGAFVLIILHVHTYVCACIRKSGHPLEVLLLLLLWPPISKLPLPLLTWRQNVKIVVASVAVALVCCCCFAVPTPDEMATKQKRECIRHR